MEFYNSSKSEEIYETTFERFFLDSEYEPRAIVAERIENNDIKLIGLVHYMAHRHCWSIENVCYLQDLYVCESERGTGVGRKLIEAVYKEAEINNWANVYWMTAEDNQTGRQLYDRVGKLTPFIKYQKP